MKRKEATERANRKSGSVAASVSEFPNLRKLTAGLRSALSADGRVIGKLTVLDREPALTASTFPSEIVTCRLDGRSKVRLYRKYSAGYHHDSHDHRRGLAYEATVYRKVLRPLRTTTPRSYGAYTDSNTGETWLILEYLGGAVPVNQTGDPDILLGPAARWIAEFHALNEARLRSTPLPFLATYDAEYYVTWARRTLLFAGDLHRTYPWLKVVCQYYQKLVDLLARNSTTVIHGEYESDNILIREGVLCPVDWESASVAAGEIDLARLTWGWPADIVQICELEYQRTRWPEGSPPDFEPTLAAARLYLRFRFLGDRPEWTTDESSSELFEDLRSVGEELRLTRGA